MARVKGRYEVWKRSGSFAVYRDGQHVGDHPAHGYEVVVHGRCTRLAGTALAAHALAEVELDVMPHRRRFVLTAEEYEEHVDALSNNLDSLMERFPFTASEAEKVAASNARYASVIEASRALIKRALMNVSPYESVLWGSHPRLRPEIAEPPELAATPRV